jgi:hypothetical protein
MGEGDGPGPGAQNHPLEPARAFLLYHGLHEALGARALIHVELECRGSLTSAELNDSPMLADTSRSRIYNVLRDMRDEGVVTREYGPEASSPPRYQLAEEVPTAVFSSSHDI